MHPDKTFIGRLTRGFDFLGFDFDETGLTGSSERSLTRQTEKTAQLYERGASQERIGQYQHNWLRWLKGCLGDDFLRNSARIR